MSLSLLPAGLSTGAFGTQQATRDHRGCTDGGARFEFGFFVSTFEDHLDFSGTLPLRMITLRIAL